MRIREHIEKIAELRVRIREANDNVSDWELRDLWEQAQSEIGMGRLFGDLVLAAFFEGERPKEREAKRGEYASAVVGGEAERYRGRLEEWRYAERPLAPFHWEIEFPEFFQRENPGFDAIVGNPPFLGGKRISTTLGGSYRDWLAVIHPASSSNADLVAHFFRRAFHVLKTEGTFGLIATNTIAQGDTRASGLRWICQHGGEIFAARRRVKWPGLAAVVVSVLHIVKGTFSDGKLLDDKKVQTITAFLFHRGGHDDPARFTANAGKSFVGNYVLGMGFTFDDTDTTGVATSLAEMRRLIEKDSRNGERIFPYLGGEEINSSPSHTHHRYVINFGSMSEAEARRWPDLLAIVEAKVKPERMLVKRKALLERWWQFAEKQPALQAAIYGLQRVLVISQTSRTLAFTFLPTRMVYSHKVIVFPFDAYSPFAALQSRLHDLWARFFGSTMKDDAVYTPSDCFETFPFPEQWETHPALGAAGKAYYEFRAALMVKNDEGLTKTYNHFHDPDELNPEIEKLRELHEAMDRAVLDAYGWSDINTDCEFLLDYEIDEEDWGNKKKPYRYRWPDEVRDEVLARLLELNAQRAKDEARSSAGTTKKRGTRVASQRAHNETEIEDLFS